MSSIRSPTKTIVISGTPSGANYWNLSGNNINNNNSGVVGINTSNPNISYSLDVSGSANISGNLVVNGSPVSGPSYTYSREHYFVGQNAGAFPYNTLLPITFWQRVSGATNIGQVFSGVLPDASINLLQATTTNDNGGIAFICPTTLSNITGSINFGFRDTSANDISLNIYKTSITNAYTSFATGATLLSSSRFIYNTPSTVANITVPVNVTSAGLTNNDIVYVGFQMLPGGTNLRFAMRYTLGFS